MMTLRLERDVDDHWYDLSKALSSFAKNDLQQVPTPFLLQIQDLHPTQHPSTGATGTRWWWRCCCPSPPPSSPFSLSSTFASISFSPSTNSSPQVPFPSILLSKCFFSPFVCLFLLPASTHPLPQLYICSPACFQSILCNIAIQIVHQHQDRVYKFAFKPWFLLHKTCLPSRIFLDWV